MCDRDTEFVQTKLGMKFSSFIWNLIMCLVGCPDHKIQALITGDSLF